MIKISHLFFPKEENNHRAKILHPLNIIILAIVLFASSFFIRNFSNSHPEVLGVSINVTVEELLNLTNLERQKAGLAPLALDEKLMLVANNKSKDMLAKDYWAHNSPDGRPPWYFFNKEGYSYLYAGENLARGFNNSKEAVDAWMKSEKHRENILSPNFSEVGFSIREGKLQGEDTILIVEEFGEENALVTANTPLQVTAQSIFLGSGAQKDSVFNKLLISQGVVRLLILLFILAFIIDMVIINRRGVKRVVSHNLDHVLFLAAILAIGFLIFRGAIL